MLQKKRRKQQKKAEKKQSRIDESNSKLFLPFS